MIKITERSESAAYPRTRNIKVEVGPSDILISASLTDLANIGIVVGVRSLAVRVPRKDPQTVRELDDRVDIVVGCDKVVEPGGYADGGEALATIVDPVELESSKIRRDQFGHGV